MKKKPEQTEITQKNIQDAFWTLYTKQSIDTITVKNICNLAGYNRSTFYQYFEDVYDVLHRFENQILSEVDEFVLQLVEQADSLDASQTLQAIFGLLAHLNKHIAVLFGPHGDTEFTHKIVEHLKPIWTKYFFCYEKNYTPAEVDLLMEFYISGLLSMYQRWLFGNNNVSMEQIIKLSYQILPDTNIFKDIGKELWQ